MPAPSPKNVMAKNYQQLWKDVASASNEGKAVRTLAEIVLDKPGRTFILGLERSCAELCMEILDRGIAEHKLKTTEKHTFFTVLRRLAAIHGRLPESMMITDEIKVSDEILASGGFADVRTGTYKGCLVAVKTIRVAKQDDFQKIRKQFCKEVILWNTLSHPNILKLEGVQGDMDKGQLITISEWMTHGNIMEFIRTNHVNRLELLHGAAQGLSYLHDCAGLTHGDLKGANVLMSNGSPPRACLADFGFMTMVLDPGQPMSCSAQLQGGTLMFMSPELLTPSKFGSTESVPTPEGDIYAFGLVIYQVLTGRLPFPGLGMAEIVMKVVEGVRPTKPENASAIGLSDPLWSFVRRCWDGEMKLRPKVAEVVSQLGRATAGWSGVMPPCAQVESVVAAPLDPVSDSMAHRGIFPESSSSVVSDSESDSMAHYGMFLRSSPGAVLESPAVSPTFSTSSDLLSTASTQCTELPSPEAREVVIKPFSEPEPVFGVSDLVVKDDRNPPNIRQTGGNRARVPSVPPPQFQGRLPHNTPPQPDLSLLHHPFSRALYPGVGPQILYPGIETQALSPPEHRRRQPESRASTLSQEEQLSDDMPVVHRHLEKRYEPPPSQLPKKERRHFRELGRDLGRRFLHFVGIRKESPQPKQRSAFYHTAGGSSLPNLPFVPGSQKAGH